MDDDVLLDYFKIPADDDLMYGEYRVFVTLFAAPRPVPWRLTAAANGEVVWVEEGTFESDATASRHHNGDKNGDADISSDGGDGAVDRPWALTHSSSVYYYQSKSALPASETFTATLDGYDANGSTTDSATTGMTGDDAGSRTDRWWSPLGLQATA